MILLDVNLLLNAYNIAAPRHAAAKGWLESIVNSDSQFGLAWLLATLVYQGGYLLGWG